MNTAISNQFKKLELGKLIDISIPKIVTTEKKYSDSFSGNV